MKNFYILAGCNGAGKTTVAYHILPDLLKCKEFVNADEIAKGISPFQPEKSTYAAGKIMSRRIDELMEQEKSFAIETTLSAITYLQKIKVAQEKGYYVTLIYFWLQSVELAKTRVRLRVEEGGHSIPDHVVERRYEKGLNNFFHYFLPLCDNIMLFDNSNQIPKLVMTKLKGEASEIFDTELFNKIESYVKKWYSIFKNQNH